MPTLTNHRMLRCLMDRLQCKECLGKRSGLKNGKSLGIVSFLNILPF